jgi:hypothetical protein
LDDLYVLHSFLLSSLAYRKIILKANTEFGKEKKKELRKISDPKRDELSGKWCILLNKELKNLYPSIVWVVKSRQLHRYEWKKQEIC